LNFFTSTTILKTKNSEIDDDDDGKDGGDEKKIEMITNVT